MSKEYHTKKHCKYMIKLHIIFVTKYRKSILTGEIDDDMKQIIYDISKKDDSLFSIDSMETDQDHVHMLVDIDPSVSATSIVSRIKQMSTIEIWKKYPTELKKSYWKENTFWSDGYFVCSTGDANMETIKKYIEEQG
ncbi:MAG: IS200/IS605 family transposase [Methanomassiliicoccales archaeon]|jgi:putative transposase